MADNKESGDLLKERFEKLPQVVRDAFTSADVSQNLRKLADMHKLHVDQWETLENEVQYTLLGIEPSEELEENIKKEVKVSDDVAHELAIDIGKTIFEPIRQALERELEHPNAKVEAVSVLETSRKEILAKEQGAVLPSVATSVVSPATPPSPPPSGTAVRGPIDLLYLSNAPSHERSTIEGDPYREQVK